VRPAPSPHAEAETANLLEPAVTAAASSASIVSSLSVS
jgi:hypothetical protein